MPTIVPFSPTQGRYVAPSKDVPRKLEPLPPLALVPDAGQDTPVPGKTLTTNADVTVAGNMKIKRASGKKGKVLYTVQDFGIPGRSASATPTFGGGAKMKAKSVMTGVAQELANEQSAFSSISTWSALALKKVSADTRHMETPNPLRTAVACMVMDKVFSVLSHRYGGLLEELKQELLQSIYVDWEGYLKRNPVAAAAANFSEDEAEPAAGEEDGQSTKDQKLHRAFDSFEGTTAQHYAVASLRHRSTFFSAHQNLQSQRVVVIGRPARVLQMTIKVWQDKFCRCVLKTLHSYVKATKAHRKKACQAADKAFLRRCTKNLDQHFRAWRQHVFEKRHQCKVVYEENSRVRLVHRMGRRIKALEEIEAKLTEKYEHLVTEHNCVLSNLHDMQRVLDKFSKAIHADPDASPQETEATDGVPSTNATTNLDLGASSTQLQSPPQVLSPTHGPRGTPNSLDAQLLSSMSMNPTGGPSLGTSLAASIPRATVVEGEELDPEAIEADIEKVMSYPNKMGKLHALGQPQPSAAEVAAEEQKRADAAAIVARDRMLAQQAKRQTHYRDVLSWVNVKIQSFVTSDVALKRCSNFTADWKDSQRYAYLLMSLGSPRKLLDEVLSTKDMMQRAECVIRHAVSLVGRYMDIPLQPTDIAKGRGGRNSAFLFQLYELYGDESKVDEKMAEILSNTSFGSQSKLGSFLRSPKSRRSIDGSDGAASMAGSFRQASSPDLKGAGSTLHRTKTRAQIDDEPLPDEMYVEWYKSLAAPDSDTEDVEEEEKKRISTVEEAVNHLLTKGRRMTMARQKSMGDPVLRAKQRSQTRQRVREWVRDLLMTDLPNEDPITATNLGNAVSLVEKVLRHLRPDTRDISMLAASARRGDLEATKAAEKDAFVLQLRQVEALLKKCRMGSVKFRDHRKVKLEDDVVTMKELLTALYVSQRSVTVLY